MAEFGDIVVGLDLGGVGLGLKAESGDEICGHLGPIHFRVGSEVSIEVAHGTVDFAH